MSQCCCSSATSLFDAPDGHQVILIQPCLTKDLLGDPTLDKASSLLIPSAEYLIVALLLVGSESPGDGNGSLARLRLVLLLERLLERVTGVGGSELHLRGVHIGRWLRIGRWHEGRKELGLNRPSAHPAECARWLTEACRLRLLELRLLLERLLLRESCSHGSLHRSEACWLALERHLRAQSTAHEAGWLRLL